MKKTYIYTGIGAWLAVIGLLATAIMLSSSTEDESRVTGKHGMGEVVTHPITSDTAIAIRVTSATIQLDSQAPQTCLLGTCIEGRKAGKYMVTVNAEVTNLSSEEYYDLEGRFELEATGGERWATSPVFDPQPVFDFSVGLGGLPKGQTKPVQLQYLVDPPISKYALVIKTDWSEGETRITLDRAVKHRPELCSGSEGCFGGFTVDNAGGNIVILDVEDNVKKGVVLSLVDPPKKDEKTYQGYLGVLEGFCPTGTYALFDEDDGFEGSKENGQVGKLYCEGKPVNEQVLDMGLATLNLDGCRNSEYAMEAWARRHGCG